MKRYIIARTTERHATITLQDWSYVEHANSPRRALDSILRKQEGRLRVGHPTFFWVAEDTPENKHEDGLPLVYDGFVVQLDITEGHEDEHEHK